MCVCLCLCVCVGVGGCSGPAWGGGGEWGQGVSTSLAWCGRGGDGQDLELPAYGGGTSPISLGSPYPWASPKLLPNPTLCFWSSSCPSPGPGAPGLPSHFILSFGWRPSHQVGWSLEPPGGLSSFPTPSPLQPLFPHFSALQFSRSTQSP